MKQTSRKKVLVSSVAMMMVATVSLGSATYAWFTSSTTSTAKGINVQTIKSSKLEISKLNKTWGTTVNYGMTAAQTYLPISSGDGVNWYSANAVSRDSYEANTAEAATKQTGYYFKEQLNVRNNGDADVTNASITFNLDNATKPEYVRVALVPVTDTDDNTTVLPTPAAADFRSGIYGEDTTAYKALVGTDLTKNESFSEEITPKNVYKLELGENGLLAAHTTEYYNLYVWFEGQDTDCVDEKAGAVIGDITFTITGQTADQA